MRTFYLNKWSLTFFPNNLIVSGFPFAWPLLKLSILNQTALSFVSLRSTVRFLISLGVFTKNSNSNIFVCLPHLLLMQHGSILKKDTLWGNSFRISLKASSIEAADAVIWSTDERLGRTSRCWNCVFCSVELLRTFHLSVSIQSPLLNMTVPPILSIQLLTDIG